MRHSIPKNICLRFFAGPLIALFGAVSFSVPSSAYAIAPNQNPTKIISDDFESGASTSWTEFNDLITTVQVHSGTRALYYNGWPGVYKIFSPTTREVYFKVWWYLPTEFNFTFAGGTHFWRFYTTTFGYQIDTSTNGFNSIDIFYLFGPNEGVYRSAAALPKGRWFKFEFYTILNDPGVANGTAKVWIDGVLKFDKTNTDLKATSANFNRFDLTTNYNQSPGAWYMDDVEVWNGCPPGSSCKAGSTPVSLAPPSNLKVVPAP
ncbi:MAG: hypothetical protein L0387_09595 [Acidobacteria bacterium]|nr:hypothetical protein [Acidobacteriota bacterium]